MRRHAAFATDTTGPKLRFSMNSVPVHPALASAHAPGTARQVPVMGPRLFADQPALRRRLDAIVAHLRAGGKRVAPYNLTDHDDDLIAVCLAMDNFMDCQGMSIPCTDAGAATGAAA